MKVFLTGGTGRVGTSAVAYLAEHGHEITVVGRTPGLEIPRATYRQCTITEYEALQVLMRGHDAVVHLAAIPDPVGYPGREVFQVNDLGTFHVFEAAAELGIRRVVAASSINALGYFFGDRGFPLPWLPVDEATPALATDAYSFSKQVMESIGHYYWERDRISSVFLRLPAVYPHERVLERPPDAIHPQHLLREILDLPDDERVSRVRSLHESYDRHRSTHRLDKVDRARRGSLRGQPSPHLGGEELSLMGWKANLFAYIDELDSAQAIERGLTAGYDGSHPLFVNARRNSARLPVADLARLFWPPVPEIRLQWQGDDSLCSIDRARALIGFDPQWEM